MKATAVSQWVPFGFSVALSAICLVTFVATGNSGAWIPAFLSFTPMAFFLAVASQNQTRAQIEVLEARIRQLEADSPASLASAPDLGPVGLATELRATAHAAR